MEADERNKQTSLDEVRDFINNPPDRYTAYIGGNGNLITTWMGDVLCRNIVYTGKKRISGHLSTEYLYFRCTGINGIKYWGSGHGEGIYCRLRKLKNQ